MPFIVFFIFCLFIVVAFFGWWTLLLIPLFIGAAILDGIIKDNDARKKAEREREKSYRDRIKNAYIGVDYFKEEESKPELAAAVKDYMSYCHKTEYKLSGQTGWKARRTLRRLRKRRERWWKKHSEYIRFLENHQRHNEL